METEAKKRQKARNALKNQSSTTVADVSEDTPPSMQLYDSQSDIWTVSSDNEAPEGKDPSFEFTDNAGVMRIARMWMCLQILYLMIEHPTTQIPVIFRIMCRGAIYYSGRFYSRIVVDLIYFLDSIFTQFATEIGLLRNDPGNFEVGNRDGTEDSSETARKLAASDYIEREDLGDNPDMETEVDYLNPRNWHAIKVFSHFYLSAFFAVMFLLFTLKYWEIQDYTHRKEVREWMKDHVIDGWYRRGLLTFVSSLGRGAAVMIGIVLLSFIIAHQFTYNSIPEARMIGAGLTMVISILLIGAFLGFFGIYSAESVFTRYVSQNVSYTSSIILKRVVKAKVNIGLLLMMVVYTPALYVFLQAISVVIDWNDSLNQEHRRNTNYFVPCYFLAFPPFTEQNRGEATCPVHSYVSTSQTPRVEGYYRDKQVLPCDSYFGVVVYTTALVFLMFLLASYAFSFYRFVDLAESEFKTSTRTETVRTLIGIREDLYERYVKNFSLFSRRCMESTGEMRYQLKYVIQAIKWFIDLGANLTVWLLVMVLSPLIKLYHLIGRAATGCWFFFCQTSGDRSEDEMDEDEALALLEGKSQGTEMQNSVFKPGASQYTVATHLSTVDIVINTVHAAGKLAGTGVLKLIGDKNIKAMRVKVAMIKTWYSTMKVQSKGTNLGKLGGRKGGWRVSLTIESQTKKINLIKNRIIDELRIARKEYVADHELSISILDSTIDTAGVFMLVCQYRWDAMYWTLVLMFEMTLYAFVASYSGFLNDWRTRLNLTLYINLLFGVATFIMKPFLDDRDKWLDTTNRILVALFVLVSLYYNDNVPQGTNDNAPVDMYDPFSALSYIMAPEMSTTAVLADVALTAFVYIYVINVMAMTGLFSAMKRKIEGAIFAMNDHILNLLIRRLERLNIGRENIFEGLQLVTQWDDVIKDQRRYALLPYPDIRPPNLMTFSEKMIEVKWASFFNLNIANLRNSMGLSLLHTSICNASSEIARWIIFTHPHLLNAEDFQRDTPILIGIKECSYFLEKYGEQNDEFLTDGSGYDDDLFLQVYPEIHSYRDSVERYGEYLPEMGEKYALDAFELRSLNQSGYFIETRFTDKNGYIPSFREFKSNLSKYATQEEIEAEKAAREAFEAKFKKEEEETELTPEQRREQAKKEAKQAAAEKASLYKKRFPEDDYQDDYESGQVASWAIIGLSVPDSNLYIDPLYKKYQMKHETVLEIKDDDSDSEDEDWYYDKHKPLDLRYNVESLRKPVLPNKYTSLIPAGHHHLATMKDWEILKKKRRFWNKSTAENYGDLKYTMKHIKDASLGRVTMSRRLELEREVRFKVCKFAEVLLSDELQHKVGEIHWDDTNYKDLNKIANEVQGRLAQNLAMSCNLNPPARFTRISEWTTGVSMNVFDEHPHEDYNPLVHGAVQAGKLAKNSIGAAFEAATNILPSRLTKGKGKDSAKDQYMDLASRRAGDHPDQTDGFNDRIIHFLAECYVACRPRLIFSDCELSVAGKLGWRAIIRALRRNNCTFVMPSVFVMTRQVLTTHLDLSRNELDCGDAVLIADVLLYKQTLKFLDLSHNRIGARGFIRMCKAMKGHESIQVLNMGSNRIGPAAGRELGILLKNCQTIKVIDFSHNRLGELVQYNTMTMREKHASAARDIFVGMRNNHSLESLDLSYNHLGPDLADAVPAGVMKHPNLWALYLSGNNLGPAKGASLIFALANEPGGDKAIEEKRAFYRELTERQQAGEDVAAILADMNSRGEKSKVVEGSPSKKKKKKKKKEAEEDKVNRSKLAVIELADNHLSSMTGHACAALLRNSKTLTSLDISNNCIGYEGGEAFSDGLEAVYGLIPRDFNKLALYQNEQAKYEGRDAKVKKVVYTNLLNLNVSRNQLGSIAAQGIMYATASPNCTITNLDISDNPLGYSLEKGGYGYEAAVDMRIALQNTKSLIHLDMSDCQFARVDIVSILGGVASNDSLKRIVLRDQLIDEPSALQLAHGLASCNTLTVLDIANTRLGPKGGLLVANRLQSTASRLKYIDMSQNNIGPVPSIPIQRTLEDPECVLHTLYLAGNNLQDEGGTYLAKGMKNNTSLKDVDLSDNQLTESCAEVIADVARGLFKDGKKICDCQLTRLAVSDNPGFGMQGSKALAKALISNNFIDVEIANIGAGPGTGVIIAKALRNVSLNWRYCDISGNNLGRHGVNEICWAMRQNRSVRVLLMQDNRVGSLFGSDEDNLLNHGIALQRMILTNVLLREIDLSYNALTSNAAINLFEGLLQNHTIRRVSIRGNKIDDDASGSLEDFMTFNNVCEELDLGENEMGFYCAYAIGTGILVNRSIRHLAIDNNKLNAAGTTTLDNFVRGLMRNTSMRTLVMDSNRLGSEWGIQLADSIARNNTLVSISIKDNRLDPTAGQAILNSYRFAPFLMEVALTADEVGTKIWEEFTSVYHQKRATFTGDPRQYEGGETHVSDEYVGILNQYYPKPNKSIR